VFCLCNIKPPLVTLWTEKNPGRRFYGCGLYKARNINLVGVMLCRKGCNFFQWHDSVGNNRQKKIIVALMKEVDELKLREKDLQSR
ncbi:hypothetical protein glysoja_042742, partial [Glycine soja]